MKTIVKIVIIAGLILSINSVSAQPMNRATLNNETKHFVNTNIGFENGLVYGLGYGQLFKVAQFPVILNVEYSFPSGENIVDDFKTKIGFQTKLVEYNNFMFSVNIYGIFRRTQNDFVRLANFGSDFSGVAGYYRQRWFVAGEFGFDKAIVTHFKHSEAYREVNPGVVDGWYIPTGGNFYFGLQTGYSFLKNEINLRIGKMISQDFKSTPMIPYYLQIGYSRKF